MGNGVVWINRFWGCFFCFVLFFSLFSSVKGIRSQGFLSFRGDDYSLWLCLHVASDT